jgi:hypothetical protein
LAFESLENEATIRAFRWKISPIFLMPVVFTEFPVTQSQIAGLCQKIVAFHSGQVSCYETGYEAGTRPANRG